MESKKTESSTTVTEESHCNKCNKGFILNAKTDRYSECECRIKQRNLDRIKNSGLGKVIEKCTFESYEVENDFQKYIKDKALEYCKNYKDKKSWFYIGGQTGAGKSHICTAICNYLIQKESLTLKYIIANKLVSELKSYAMDREKYNNLYNIVMGKDVLYIDDLFKSNNITDADIKILFEIINDRYNQNKITIISSEKRIMDLEKYTELEAVTGRIIEKALGYVININKDVSKNYRTRNFLNL